uniref:Putative ixodes 10 kDa peptide protein n=1 Tax=Ixodes ricinus TaxID=34613 RepID=A0A0K8RKW9_IXORI
MQLVVFAVVLILPSFLSGESYSHTTNANNECEVYIREGGDRECTSLKSKYKNFNSTTCTVFCENGERRQFPEGVCSSGNVVCTSEVNKTLHEWLSIIKQ